MAYFQCRPLRPKAKKGLFQDAFGLSRATTAAAKQRKSLNSIEVQRQKSGFLMFFGLPSVTNTGKQRKWLISNAVFSVQRGKRAFLDAFGL